MTEVRAKQTLNAQWQRLRVHAHAHDHDRIWARRYSIAEVISSSTPVSHRSGTTRGLIWKPTSSADRLQQIAGANMLFSVAAADFLQKRDQLQVIHANGAFAAVARGLLEFFRCKVMIVTEVSKF